MPRIVPLQLLKCLKVLLDENGGILSESEVKRIAGLMTKYSKKLVSKCIYVQILKCTKTELLGEFMGAGGWSLTHMWLNDAIRARNWPLVQEILELLLLCPVDVERLKSNSAPKLVKGLCKDGDDEGVRILASKLVEQWLKVVTGDVSTSATTIMAPKASEISAVAEPVTASAIGSVKSDIVQQKPMKQSSSIEEDPLGSTEPPMAGSFAPTPAQKKASESGLVLKCVIKDGKQVWARVENTHKTQQVGDDPVPKEDAEEEIQNDEDEDEDEEEVTSNTVEDDVNKISTEVVRTAATISGNDTTGNKENEVVTKKDDKEKISTEKEKNSTEKEKFSAEKEKISIEKEKEKEKDKDKTKSSSSSDRDKKSSSSSHRSSSSHKSSSSKSSSTSSSSKSKTASSSRRSSTESKNRSKEREKDKDKERSSNKERSSDKDKHKSSSGKSSSSSSSSSGRDKDKERYREKSSSSSSSSVKKEKEKVNPITQAEKDKDTLNKLVTPSIDKLGKIPKKPKDETEEQKPTSITIPSKKASMSIEIRRDSEKTKTVKTYKSQFRSHGLTEEAPPPPSRKGLKKPNSVPVPGTAILSTLSLKRSSPPPSTSISSTSLSKDVPPAEKKAKIDMASVANPVDKIGAIKLIPPKKISTLVETNIFADALSAAMVPKKDARKRKRNSKEPGKDGFTSPPISPEGNKVAPLKFYQDTLDESKDEEKNASTNNESGAESKDEEAATNTEDDDDIPLKKVKEDIEQRVRNEKAKTGSNTDEDNTEPKSNSPEIDLTRGSPKDADDFPNISDSKPEEDFVESPKKPGPGCGPNGPPGVLLLHRRKGPKKKLKWRPQEDLEQIRFFELDENERVNVNKTFIDMKNMERFSERDAMSMVRRGFNSEDNMAPQTEWVPLIMVDDVPNHPEGSQSRERKIQSDREQTTLRALYFSHAMIPDSPTEPDIEPVLHTDFTVIPLDDITGNPDAVNDFTSMPWPDPKGAQPQDAGNAFNNGPGGDMYTNRNQFNPFIPFAAQNSGGWQIGGPNGPPMNMGPVPPQAMMCGPGGGMPGNNFNNNNMGMGMGSPNMMGCGMSPSSPSGDLSPIMGMGGMNPNINMGGQYNDFNGPHMDNGSPQFGPGPNFGPGPGNFGPNMNMNGPCGPMNGMMGGPMCNGPMNGSMGGGPMNGPGPMNGGGPMNGHMNGPGPDSRRGLDRSNIRGGGGGGGWRSGGIKNFNSEGNWRPAGSGDGNNDRGNNNYGRAPKDWNPAGGGGNNGRVCKQFMRGHCRLGNKCNFLHPRKKQF